LRCGEYVIGVLRIVDVLFWPGTIIGQVDPKPQSIFTENKGEYAKRA
jgi:hypothetical protein